ncbi:MAG: DUF2169 domain-containing protein [Deltaproteobacteria bacterium]|nr:DUF2169 domain-containing protein [Deltaproteobacteria bacterium]
MKKIKPDNMGLLFRTVEHKNRPRLSLAILGGFTLDETPRLLSEKDFWAAAAAELHETQFLDTGLPKPRGEALIAGRAWAPAGQTTTGMEVSFSVGGIHKKLVVFGDRKWKRVAGMLETYSPPEPFSQIPIVYNRAFGGPGFDRNPLGLGLAPVQTPAGEIIKPLPNVELPGRTIASPTDKPLPAGFGPLNESWVPRLKRAGTYDRQWLLKAWPYFPDNLDWTFFNAAPEDQWLDGYFHGDEKVSAINMSPDRSRISSRLPGLQARCFINKKISEALSFVEIKTNLETVWLFPGANAGIVLFRAVVETADDEAGEIEHLLIEWEPLEERRPIEYYAALLKQKLAPVPAEETPQAPPVEPPPPPPPLVMPPAGLPPELSARLARADDRIAQAEAMVRKQLIKAGHDPNKVLAPVGKSPFDGLSLEAKLAVADDLIAQAEKEAGETMKSAGINLKAMLAKAAKKPVVSPGELAQKLAGKIPRGAATSLGSLEKQTAAALDEAEEIRAQVKKIRADRETAAPPRPYTVDDVLTAKENGRDMSGWDLTGLDLSGLDLSLVVLASAKLNRAILVGANLSGADLTRADFSEADFSQADLTSIKARGARGRRAIFKNVVLVEANLDQADLSQADFSSADLKKANLKRATLSGATLAEADLTGADLSEADLDRAQAGRAKFRQAKLTGASFEEASLPAGDFTESRAERTSFVGSDLTDSHFEKAWLVKADFSRTLLDRANFDQAKAVSAFFKGARGQAAMFPGADLTQSRADAETSLPHSTFTRAKMDQACWSGAGLNGSSFSRASMHRADFSGCALAGAGLDAVSAREAKFQKADLTGANLQHGDFFKGHFRKARMVQADFQGASLYMADFFRAVMNKTTNFQWAHLKRSTFDVFKLQI